MIRSIIFAVLFSPFILNAQTDTLRSPEDIHFMIGEWRGEGWIQRGPEKKFFVQSESIVPKVNGSLLVIDGIGYRKDSARTEANQVHVAFGVIGFNKERGGLTMLSYSTAGERMENDFRKVAGTDKMLQWSFKDERGGTIRFTEDFSEKGVWREKGEYSFDGANWFQFFSMELNRTE